MGLKDVEEPTHPGVKKIISIHTGTILAQDEPKIKVPEKDLIRFKEVFETWGKIFKIIYMLMMFKFSSYLLLI